MTSYGQRGIPVDLLGPVRQAGHPIRATVSEMGPLLLGRACSSSTTPRKACSTSPSSSPTTQGLLLLDLKDLRAMLQSRRPRTRTEFTTQVRQRQRGTIGAIQRAC